MANHDMVEHGKAKSGAHTFYIDSDYISFGNQTNYLDPVGGASNPFCFYHCEPIRDWRQANTRCNWLLFVL